MDTIDFPNALELHVVISQQKLVIPWPLTCPWAHSHTSSGGAFSVASMHDSVPSVRTPHQVTRGKRIVRWPAFPVEWCFIGLPHRLLMAQAHHRLMTRAAARSRHPLTAQGRKGRLGCGLFHYWANTGHKEQCTIWGYFYDGIEFEKIEMRSWEWKSRLSYSSAGYQIEPVFVLGLAGRRNNWTVAWSYD